MLVSTGGPASVECIRDNYVCLQQASRWTMANRGPVGWVRCSGTQAGLQGEQRDCADAQGIHKYVCAYEPRECVVCLPPLVTFGLCQPKRRRGLGCLCLCSM